MGFRFLLRFCAVLGWPLLLAAETPRGHLVVVGGGKTEPAIVRRALELGASRVLLVDARGAATDGVRLKILDAGKTWPLADTP